ncbi:MAG: hypothetical protein AAGA56_25370 [Myxococcota bacterium]
MGVGGLGANDLGGLAQGGREGLGADAAGEGSTTSADSRSAAVGAGGGALEGSLPVVGAAPVEVEAALETAVRRVMKKANPAASTNSTPTTATAARRPPEGAFGAAGAAVAGARVSGAKGGDAGTGVGGNST